MNTQPRFGLYPRSLSASDRRASSLPTLTVVCWIMSASTMAYLIVCCEFGGNRLNIFLSIATNGQADIQT